MIEDIRHFEDLRESAGWHRLREVIKREKSKLMQRIADKLMDGQEVGSEEIAFHRGFYYGALWIAEYPDEVVKDLERAARREWVRARSRIARQAQEAHTDA